MGGRREAARVYHASQWHSGDVAARGARAAEGPHPKNGVLWHAGNPEEEGPLFTALVEGFRNLGYVEGRNIALEHRFPNEIPERFKSMAADLVSLNVDALVGAGIQAASALREATKTTPIIFMFLPDPVGSKLVDNLARPSGNITGLSNFAPDLIGKRLQFLKETNSKAFPGCVARQSGFQNFSLIYRCYQSCSGFTRIGYANVRSAIA
jgi:putative ABC transport system substrate-binding protein